MCFLQFKLRRSLGSLPKRLKPHCFLFRRVLGGLGLYVGLASILALFSYISFQKPNLQVLGVVIAFQFIVIGWASGCFRILNWIIDSLHANTIVYLVSAIYLIQVSYLLLRIDESQVLLRGGISYAIMTLFFPFAILQLPVWKRKILLTRSYWSSICQVASLAWVSAHLIQFLLLNPCSETSSSGRSSFLCSARVASSANLNWLFLNDFTLLKILTLFVFQALAYHIAMQENLARSTRPVRENRRSG